MNADSKKPEVAKAQAYFVILGNILQDCATHTNFAKSATSCRFAVSDRLTIPFATLSRIKTRSMFFMDAGYRGMYNMSLKDLSAQKGVPENQKLIDRMDKAELAANLFRATQTEVKIENERLRGQHALEGAAHMVGAAVRETMLKTGGTAPENIAVAEPVSAVRKRLREADRRLRAVDTLPKGTRMLNTLPEPPRRIRTQAFS
jgi:DNA-damage-inducible protein D